MKFRIRHRVVNHRLTDEDRQRGHTGPYQTGEVVVTFSRAVDATRFVDLIAELAPKSELLSRDRDRVVRFSCDPGKEHRLAQTVGAICGKLEDIDLANDAIASLIGARDGLAKIAW